mmetsp:Transcript_36913/g.42103  ORF Transcript_36913/g.42103 Transcript_36913/m.42103 type:complete len:446 (+) Transcript_36913:3-1340(+)
MRYDDGDEDEILVANTSDLPRGIKEGFAVVYHFEVKEPTLEKWKSLMNSKANKDIARLNLSPTNLTLPIALMMMDPSNKFETISGARKICRDGCILLHRGQLGMNENNGQRTVFLPERSKIGKVGDRVYPGDVIGKQVVVGNGFYLERKFTRAPLFELPVIFQDDHFAIINKPAGVVVHSPKDPNQEFPTIKPALPHVLDPPKAGTISALKRPKSIHRLDRLTSGALVIGKTSSAVNHLSTQFCDRKVKKTYTCIINGIPLKDPNSTISSKAAYELGVDVDPESDNEWQLIDSPLDDKPAITVWRAVQCVQSLQARDNHLTLVEVKPKTGRFHQIRRHMALNCDHAIVGDKEYDGNHEGAVKLRGRGLFLCSNKVVLEHPFYNTRAGRGVWDTMEESSKSFKEGKLWLHQEDDMVIVCVSVELPNKFSELLDRPNASFQEHGEDA